MYGVASANPKKEINEVIIKKATNPLSQRTPLHSLDWYRLWRDDEKHKHCRTHQISKLHFSNAKDRRARNQCLCHPSGEDFWRLF
jgi:hypothetical protein